MLAVAVAALTIRQQTLAQVPESETYQELRVHAETQYEQGGFKASNKSYMRIAEIELTDEQKRWVMFRLGDTQWRAANIDRSQSIPPEVEDARRQLEDLLDDKQQDRVWAETHESLGDSHRSTGDDSDAAARAWPHDQKALEYWAAEHDVDLARHRYLALTWRITGSDENLAWRSVVTAPLDVLENAARISVDPRDIALSHYLLAMKLRAEGGWAQLRRIEVAFEKVLEQGKKTPWYDDALYAAGRWFVTEGPVQLGDDDQWQQEPDYERAVALFQQLIHAFDRGESPFREEADKRIQEITRPRLTVSVASVFRPGLPIRFDLSFRNVGPIELALHPVDLTRDLDPPGGERSLTEWMDHLRVTEKDPIARWRIDASSVTAHKWGHRAETIGHQPPVGAYLLTATAGDIVARELVLITDVAMVLKSWPGRTLALLCDATTGEPVPGGRLHMWHYRYKKTKWAGLDELGLSNDEGLCRFEVDLTPRPGESTYGLLVTANLDGRQAFAVMPHFEAVGQAEQWRVHTIATRDRYRPGETVSWKTTMRVHDGTNVVTPAERQVRFVIRGPRGFVHEGNLRLGAYGAAWGETRIKPTWPVGYYSIDFTVGTPLETSRERLFEVIDPSPPPFVANIDLSSAFGNDLVLLGDRLDIDVEARDEFGRPLPDASVEFKITRRPFDQQWNPPAPAAGVATTTPAIIWQGLAESVEVAPVRTDSTGRVRVTIGTPGVGNHDLAYSVETRVTNSAGVTVVASSTVTVMRRAVTCFLRPRTRLGRIGKKIEVDLHTRVTPDRAVSVEGRIRVARLGSGADQPQRINASVVTTDEHGNGRFSFSPPSDGHYRLTWTLEGVESNPVTAVADLWVADDTVSDLGDAPETIQLIVDRSSYVAGETAHCLVRVPTADRFVLMTVEGAELHHEHLVHVTGTVKRVDLPIDTGPGHNLTLQAMMIDDGTLQVARHQVSVLPTDKSLVVTLRTNHPVRRPGDRVTLEISTRTLAGKPVAAEVAVVVTPEDGVLGGDAIDPSSLFRNESQLVEVRTRSTFSERPYAVAGGITVDPSDDRPRPPNQSRWDRLRDKQFDEITRPGAFDTVLVRPRSTTEATNLPVILWEPAVMTGEDGTATIAFTLPDQPLRWRATAYGIASIDAVGVATAEGTSRRSLVARLRAPAHLVAGDHVTVRGIFENHTDEIIRVRPSLDVDGATITALVQEGRPVSGQTAIGAIDVGPHQKSVVDWLLAADTPGRAMLVLAAEDSASRTEERRIVQVREHGVIHRATAAARLDVESGSVTFDLPPMHLRSSSLVVDVSAGTLTAALDALATLTTGTPSTVDGIVDQLVAFVVLTRTLDGLGVDPRLYLDRFPGLATNVDPLIARSRYVDRRIDDLLAAQHDNGGWGWHPDGPSDQIMTAYALWGLCETKVAGIDVDIAPLESAAAYLDQQIVDVETDTAHQAWMLAALASYQWMTGDRIVRPARRAALDNLWRKRDRLDASLRSLAASAAEILGDHERAVALIRTLENGAIKDPRPETAPDDTAPDDPSLPTLVHWGELEADTHWTRGAVETTALVMRAFMTVMGDHGLREGAAHWLLANRHGAGWATDRETTLAIVALAIAHRERDVGQTQEYEMRINGGGPMARSADPRGWRTARGGERFDVTTLHEGSNTLEVSRHGGRPPLFITVGVLSHLDAEPLIAETGGIEVGQALFKLVPRKTLLSGFTIDRAPIVDDQSVEVGSDIEAVITLTADRDLEYVTVTARPAAGLEIVPPASGEPVLLKGLGPGSVEGTTLVIHRRDRDGAIRYDIPRLPKGRWSLSYEQRAVVPGRFHALPAHAVAAFTPRPWGRSDELRLTVIEPPEDSVATAEERE